MDADQQSRANPFGMDEACENCARATDRDCVVHGYGDVGAEFLFVGEAPSDATQDAGVPFTGDATGERFQDILGQLGFNHSLPSNTEPELDNVYLTYLARCHSADHAPTDSEIVACEPFLNAEIRMINPEIIVPVGERALATIGEEYTTTPAEDLDVVEHHADRIRGRGFELMPMIHPAEITDEEVDVFVDAFYDLLDSDYRQTKGRRAR